jgi:hypothetical protein
MSWWRRLWQRPSSPSQRQRLFTLMMPGWIENKPSDNLRIWRDSDGDVLSLATPEASLDLPPLDDSARLQRWCRALAEGRGAGLIEVSAGTGTLGPTVSLIYKRLQLPAYIFTGMLVVPGDDISCVWTIVSGERGTTGVREAVITAQLMNAGRMTVEEYKRSWARDPYDPTYAGVDRRVLRFVSDDKNYDAQFPDHPLSRVRRVLATLPNSVHVSQTVSMTVSTG